MNLGMIGDGAIGRYVRKQLSQRGMSVQMLLVRAGRLGAKSRELPDLLCIERAADIPDDIDHMVECAGHTALRTCGAEILRRGIDLTTVSLGALADEKLYQELQRAAHEGNSTLLLASGAIGALDCLRAARAGGLDSVTYIGRKPPVGWRGSPAEQRVKLDELKDGSATHFSGSARTAATEYPKNANVAAAVALAGIGFDDTRVQLVADATVSENIHEIRASGAFGRFQFEIRGRSLPDNPRSSALAAMSVVSLLEERSRRIRF